MTLLRKTLAEPGDNEGGLGLGLSMSDVVVGQRAVKRVLPRHECHGNVIAPRRSVGCVEPAVVACPIGIPGTLMVWDRIIAARRLADPKNGGHDIRFPRKTGNGIARSRRNKDLRLDLGKGLIPKLHRVLGKVGAALVGRLAKG